MSRSGLRELSLDVHPGGTSYVRVTCATLQTSESRCAQFLVLGVRSDRRGGQVHKLYLANQLSDCRSERSVDGLRLDAGKPTVRHSRPPDKGIPMLEQPVTPTPHRRIARWMKLSVAAVVAAVFLIVVFEIGSLGTYEVSWVRPFGWGLALAVIVVPAVRLLWLSLRLREPGGLWGLGMIIGVFILLLAGSFIAPVVVSLIADKLSTLPV